MKGLLFAVSAVCLLTLPARAETVSFSCAWLGPSNARLIVNVDLVAASVSDGLVAEAGTRWGPFSAQISAQMIAWDQPSIWDDSSLHYKLSKVTGHIEVTGSGGRTHLSGPCDHIQAPTQKW